MRMHRPKIIVIEGLDGSGKGTQAQMLLDYFTENKIHAVKYSFPDYDSKTGKKIQDFLQGRIKVDNIKDIAMMYAEDRKAFFNSFEWQQVIENDIDVVIFDRYVFSNIIHQAMNINDIEERMNFIEHLFNIEYAINNIPIPDIELFLHVSDDIRTKLIKDRGRSDIYEDDTEGLSKLRKRIVDTIFASKDFSKKFPDINIKFIACDNGVHMYSRDYILKKIKEKL